MSTPPSAAPVHSDFMAALDHLVNARRRDSTKHREVKKWFANYFGVAGTASIVTEGRQAYNRVNEQFSDQEPHVVFVYEDQDTFNKLVAQVQQRVYPSLQTVLLVQQQGGGGLQPTTVLNNGSSAVLHFYQSAFPGINVQSLPGVAGGPAAAAPAVNAPAANPPAANPPAASPPAAGEPTPVNIDWNLALTTADPCGLVGLQRAMIQALSALRAGKHVILLGPPGTGKTELARCICETLGVPYDLSTATSEWTTFDTIGGYFTVPGAGNNLDFVPGVVTAAIEKNRWLVVDELNRADIDKALGELFTVFAGAPVSLPYKKEQGGKLKTVVISQAANSSSEPDVFTYLIQPDWRVIGTMNTFDKASLYQLSFAFMRRFAFVNVDAPTQTEFAALISTHTSDIDAKLAAAGGTDTASGLLAAIFAPLPGAGLDALQLRVGPAIFLDVVRYLRSRLSSGVASVPFKEQVAEAVAMYLFPQFEGREQDHEAIVAALASTLTLDAAARAAFSARLADWTGYREVTPG